jgi:hypothetical protein
MQTAVAIACPTMTLGTLRLLRPNALPFSHFAVLRDRLPGKAGDNCQANGSSANNAGGKTKQSLKHDLIPHRFLLAMAKDHCHLSAHCLRDGKTIASSCRPLFIFLHDDANLMLE